MADEPVLSIEAPSKAVGSTWTTYFDHKWWPVVICGPTTTPQIFLEGRRKPDHIPAILLGKHKYIWVTDDNTEEYDPNYAYVPEPVPGKQIEVHEDDDQEVVDEKQRSIAFNQDAREFKDDIFWSNFLHQQSQARKLQRETNARATKITSKKRHRTEDNDKIEFVGAERKSFSISTSSEYSNSHLQLTKTRRQAGSGHYPTRQATPEGRQHNSTGIIDVYDHEESGDNDAAIVTGSNNGSDPFTDSSERQQIKAQRKGARARPSSEGMAPPQLTEKGCRILLGDHDQSIIANRARCAESEYLKARETYDETSKEHIIDLNGDKRAVKMDLTHAELQRIWIYLWHGDLGPQFLKDPDDYRPFGRLSEDEKQKAAQQLAFAFAIASKIQHVKLQDLVEKKLNALYPLPAMSLLTVALILTRMPPTEIMTDPEQKMGNWLIGSLAGQFWHLAKHHTGTFQRLLQENDELREGVYHRMQMNADEGLEGGEELL